MKALKLAAIEALRKVHLLPVFDHLKLQYEIMANFRSNKAFAKRHPGFLTPPPSLAYDAYGHVNWTEYLRSGLQHAESLAGLIHEWSAEQAESSILEWGCGPARVIRHLREYLRGSLRVVGSDYNSRTIDWCRQCIPGIEFVPNDLQPPVSLESASFDCIYGISVFTHLSEEMHYAWRDELVRLLKPGGLIIVTTAGDHYRDAYLREARKSDYDSGQLVVQGGVREGKKWYTAFHSPVFVREKLFGGLEIVRHMVSPVAAGHTQDIWVVRKPRS